MNQPVPRDPVVPSQKVMGDYFSRRQEGPAVPNLRFGTAGSLGSGLEWIHQ